MAVRPVYAPALVVFVGGPRWAGSFGGGGGVGWVPLAPGEAFVPAYHVSPGYVNRVNVVNVTNVTNVTNITNVTNVRYANQNVPGAVTAISRADFANSRAVSRSGVNVSSQTVASAQVIGMTAPVSPRRESLMGHSADSMTSVPRPRESVLARPVVTRSVPPPAPVPFAARQQALAERRRAGQVAEDDRHDLPHFARGRGGLERRAAAPTELEAVRVLLATRRADRHGTNLLRGQRLDVDFRHSRLVAQTRRITPRF